MRWGLALALLLLLRGSALAQNVPALPVAATQSGIWTVQPGNTANTTAWLVTGTGGTFPATQSGAWNITNVTGTVSLPTGAATAANQTTALTSLQLIDDLRNAIGSFTAGQAGALVLGAVTSTTPTYTVGQSHPLSLQPDGSVRVALTNGGGGGTSATDDADFTDSSTAFTLAGCVAESVSPTTVTEGDMGACAMTLNRAVKVTLYAPDGTPLTPADDATQGTTVKATGPQQMFEAKDQDGAALPNSVTEGQSARGAASLYGVQYHMLVSEDGSLALGTTTTPFVVGGNVAHDAADAGSPIKIGLKASNSLAGLTLVANADRTDAFAGLDGVQIVRPHSNLEDRVSQVVGVTDGSSTSLVAAQGSGVRFCATTFIVSNSSATNVEVNLRDGTAGTVLATIPASANMGGAVIPLQTPLCTTANTAMAMDPSASATTVTVTAVGFKTKL
jgi:hypothetical protein